MPTVFGADLNQSPSPMKGYEVWELSTLYAADYKSHDYTGTYPLVFNTIYAWKRVK